MPGYGLDAGETAVLKALKTPERVQHFLDTDIAYNKEPDGDVGCRNMAIMTEESNEEPKVMAISAQGIPGALSKAERYRYLNEPWQAESICRDVLAVDPTNQMASILLVLSLTDQFDRGISDNEISHTLRIVERLTDEYHRAYYSGIVHERQAIAVFRNHPDYRSRKQVQRLFQKAMELYRQARSVQPPNNDDATLRWNACVRFLERNWGLQ